MRALVAQLYLDGKSQRAIAQAVGLTRSTLLLNYPSELKSTSQAAVRRIQRDKRKAEE
jgi:transposase